MFGKITRKKSIIKAFFSKTADAIVKCLLKTNFTIDTLTENFQKSCFLQQLWWLFVKLSKV